MHRVLMQLGEGGVCNSAVVGLLIERVWRSNWPESVRLAYMPKISLCISVLRKILRVEGGRSSRALIEANQSTCSPAHRLEFCMQILLIMR